MVSKLKELSEDDLEDISNFLSETIVKKISSSVKSQKEILDMDVSIEITYPDENGELDVDASIEIDTDELSDLSNERIDEVIDESYLELDEYINEHYR
jgi:phosphoserine phosphatase